MKMKEKKAQLSQFITILLIIIFAAILIAAVLILLFLIVYFNIKKVSDVQTCQDSIILRSSGRIGTATEIGTKSIPLKCKTEKYCITSTKYFKGISTSFLALLTGK